MKFPRDLLRFLYRIFFQPFSLRADIQRLDPGISTAASLLTRPVKPFARPLRDLALFYILLVPLLLGFGTALVLSLLGREVNWLNLTFYLAVGIAITSSFSIGFCIAFLLPFSIVLAIWSTTSFTPTMGILLSLMLGLAYGLTANSAKWGLIAGVVYGAVMSLIVGPWEGSIIGAAFLIGYFRILFYIVEAPLSWILAALARQGDAVHLWRYQPVRWDELIWLPLPGLANHLCALQEQDEPAFQVAIRTVNESFRQKGAAERVEMDKGIGNRG